MLDEKDLQAIATLIDKQFEKQTEHLERIDSRLDKMESRLDALEESSEITRDGVNVLLQWAEECSRTIKLPLPKVM